MNQKIFILDDEPGMVKVAGGFLSQYGYDVRSENNPIKGIQQIIDNPPELLLLDIQMPKKDGFDVLKELKGNPRTSDVPVIMVSVQKGESDIVLALGLGADDYIVKPFHEKELLARIKAVLRRKGSQVPRKDLQVGPLKIDLSTYKAELEGKLLALNPKEFQLLEFFLRREGLVITRATIAEEVWGTPHLPESRTIDTYVKTLRKKLGIFGDWVKTLRGIGYRFEMDE